MASAGEAACRNSTVAETGDRKINPMRKVKHSFDSDESTEHFVYIMKTVVMEAPIANGEAS